MNLPSLNWFISCLIENVGENIWINKTKEELEKDKKQGIDYPYKVIHKPIPKGKDIVLKCSRTYTIKCDSEETRQLIVDMATAYDQLERKYYHLCHEFRASEWHLISELPPHFGGSSISEDSRRYLVYGPELRYIGAPHWGFRRNGEWYLDINGKEIKYTPTHFRFAPPIPNEKAKPYEEVRLEVERLRKELGYANY
jgi:hypothetical protein